MIGIEFLNFHRKTTQSKMIKIYLKNLKKKQNFLYSEINNDNENFHDENLEKKEKEKNNFDEKKIERKIDQFNKNIEIDKEALKTREKGKDNENSTERVNEKNQSESYEIRKNNRKLPGNKKPFYKILSFKWGYIVIRRISNFQILSFSKYF